MLTFLLVLLLSVSSAYAGGAFIPPQGDPAAITSESDTLDTVYGRGSTITLTAADLASSVCIGDGTTAADTLWCVYVNGSGSVVTLACDGARANCTTLAHMNQAGSNWAWVNDEGDTCVTFNDTTYAMTVSTTNNCADALTITGNMSLTGDLTVTGAIAATSTVQGYTKVTNVSSTPYTLLTTDCGSILHVLTGAGEIDLLTNMTGCVVCIREGNAVATVLDPGSGDTWNTVSYNIENGTAIAPSADDSITLAAVQGNFMCFFGYNSSNITVLPGTLGTISDTN